MSDGSTGRVLGTIVGAVAGYFTGGASYVALGASLGGAAGSLLDPKKKTETNRLDDIRVSISKYGEGIPETWGNNVPTATWIWATPIIQIGTTTSAGGKGGGTENTSYRQFLHGLISLGRTPPAGTTVQMRKLWIDGKLNYDASTGLSAAQALATEENPFQSILIFPGFDDQLPIPIIEAWMGIGNVPAFRGQITAFIYGLECPGGRVPQIQAEFCLGADQSVTLSAGLEFALPSYSRITFSQCPMDGGPVKLFAERTVMIDGDAVSSKIVDIYSLGVDYCVKDSSIRPGNAEGNAAGNFLALPGSADIAGICFRQVSAATAADSGINTVLLQDGTTKSFDVDIPAFGQSTSCWAKSDNRFAICGDINQFSTTAILFDWDSGAELGRDASVRARGLWIGQSVVWVLADDGSGALSIQTRDHDVFGLIDSAALPSELQTFETLRFEPNGDSLAVLAMSGEQTSWWSVSSDLAFEQKATDDAIAPGAPEPANAIGFKGSTFYGVGNPGPDQWQVFTASFSRVVPVAANAKDFIRSQSLRAGLTETQLDLSSIDETFHGLTIKGPGSARANIAPVLTYAGIGVVEEDGLLRFFNRKDKTSVVTMPYDELGFAEDGSEPGNPFPLVRSNSQELSKSLTLTFNDPNFDYQASTVKAFFPSVSVGADDSETLDMAIDGTSAQTVCRRMLLERRLSQITRSFKISRAYSYLSAGDVATFLSKDGSYGDWVISKLTDTGAAIEGECFPCDTDLLIQSVPGPGTYRAQQIEALPTPPRLILGDWPILSDADNNAGIYAVFARLSPGASGATLYVGPDDSSLEERGSVFHFTTAGIADSVLGDWPTYEMDEVNTVIVHAPEDSFASVTRDVLIDDARANAVAFGQAGRWEILQFASAVYLGANQWLISRFLRGLRGTEYARGSHQEGDVFVLLVQPAMLRPNMDVGALNQDKKYRAVALGRSINSTSSQTYANTGEGLKPFSPAGLRYNFDGNDIIFEIDRRTRLSNSWITGVLPLGEAGERYQLRLYTDDTFTTVMRVFASTTPTVTYSQTQQSADGYTPGDPIFARVGQISDSVGLGHELEATL